MSNIAPINKGIQVLEKGTNFLSGVLLRWLRDVEKMVVETSARVANISNDNGNTVIDGELSVTDNIHSENGFLQSGSTGNNGKLQMARTSDGVFTTNISTDGSNLLIDQGASGYTAFTMNSTERMRLTTAGTLSIGNSSPKTWGSAYTPIQIGQGSSFYGQSSASVTFMANHLYNDGADKFLGADNVYGSQYFQSNGIHLWRATSATGTDGNAATLVERMRLSQSGVLSIGNGSPKDWDSLVDVMQIGKDGSIMSTDTISGTSLMSHLYYSGGYKFLGNNDVFGSLYLQNNGVHTWYSTTLPGEDGDVATIDEGMRLTTAGQLKLPKISASGSGNPVYVTSTGYLWENTSSRRFKDNERPIEIDTSKVLQVDSVTYERINNDGASVCTEHGPIAEDVNEIETAFVTFDEDGETPRGLNDRTMLFALIEEVKKLRLELNELKNS